MVLILLFICIIDIKMVLFVIVDLIVVGDIKLLEFIGIYVMLNFRIFNCLNGLWIELCLIFVVMICWFWFLYCIVMFLIVKLFFFVFSDVKIILFDDMCSNFVICLCEWFNKFFVCMLNWWREDGLL